MVTNLKNSIMSKEINKEQLERITEICQDGFLGYQHAASHLENGELKTIFNRLAQQRKLFAEELKKDARTLGAHLDDTESTRGYFHRAWIDVKDFFSTSENSAVIVASLTGEEKAKEVYQDVLKDDTLPAFIKERLETQLKFINTAIMQLQELNKQVA
jgi:uncharacterized protein (TIGR02284 family)